MAMNPYVANWWHALADGRLQCDLCPRQCRLSEGQRGLCFVRQRQNNQLILDTWGRSSGFCVDPIEKKPLNHFYPGSSILSFGTAGCNLACKFCQNWDISKSRDTDKLGQQVLPEHIANACQQLQTPAVAFTYNDPIIFAEYAMDTADACHALGIRTVAVTAGYVSDAPRKAFFAKMDAANVDLKGFTPRFYQELCAGDLQTVLETLVYIRHQTQCWLEITTLLIPGENDSAQEITALSKWIFQELGSDVPLHFSAFHPDYKLLNHPPTTVQSVTQARRIAMDQGLRFVYTGNIHDEEGGTTYCPHCHSALIRRDWHQITHYAMQAGDHCSTCNGTIAGRFEVFDNPSLFKPFGRQRIPIQFTPAA